MGGPRLVLLVVGEVAFAPLPRGRMAGGLGLSVLLELVDALDQLFDELLDSGRLFLGLFA